MTTHRITLCEETTRLTNDRQLRKQKNTTSWQSMK